MGFLFPYAILVLRVLQMMQCQHYNSFNSCQNLLNECLLPFCAIICLMDSFVLVPLFD